MINTYMCAYISQKQKSVHYDIRHYIIISSVWKRISNAKSLFLTIFISSSLQPFSSSFVSDNGFFRLLLQYLISTRKDGKTMNRLSISFQNSVSIWHDILHFWSNWTRRKCFCRSILIYFNNDTAHKNTTVLHQKFLKFIQTWYLAFGELLSHELVWLVVGWFYVKLNKFFIESKEIDYPLNNSASKQHH